MRRNIFVRALGYDMSISVVAEVWLDYVFFMESTGNLYCFIWVF